MSEASASDAAEREQLARCSRAYDAGDFSVLRKLARSLNESENEQTSAAARDLLGRVSVDGVALGVLACCLLFFLLVVKNYAF